MWMLRVFIELWEETYNMNTSIKKKIGATGILLFLGLTIVFQLAYCIWLRRMISNVGVFYSNLENKALGWNGDFLPVWNLF